MRLHELESGDQLTWPGVDRVRAYAALQELERAAQLLAELAGYSWSGLSHVWRLKTGLEHVRLARGYLGAVGFERSAVPRRRRRRDQA